MCKNNVFGCNRMFLISSRALMIAQISVVNMHAESDITVFDGKTVAQGTEF